MPLNRRKSRTWFPKFPAFERGCDGSWAAVTSTSPKAHLPRTHLSVLGRSAGSDRSVRFKPDSSSVQLVCHRLSLGLIFPSSKLFVCRIDNPRRDDWPGQCLERSVAVWFADKEVSSR